MSDDEITKPDNTPVPMDDRPPEVRFAAIVGELLAPIQRNQQLSIEQIRSLAERVSAIETRLSIGETQDRQLADRVEALERAVFGKVQ